jgi:hypothetical protein
MSPEFLQSSSSNGHSQSLTRRSKNSCRKSTMGLLRISEKISPATYLSSQKETTPWRRLSISAGRITSPKKFMNAISLLNQATNPRPLTSAILSSVPLCLRGKNSTTFKLNPHTHSFDPAETITHEPANQKLFIITTRYAGDTETRRRLLDINN